MRVRSLGQVDLAAVLDAADTAARLLEAFAQKLRREGTPLEAELLQVAARINAKFPDLTAVDEDVLAADPDVIRGDRLGELNQLRNVLTASDQLILSEARNSIAAAISTVRAESVDSVRKRLINRNAFPNFESGTALIPEAVRIENLIDVYEEDVIGRPRLKGPNLAIILAGIAVGIVGLGAIAFALRK